MISKPLYFIAIFITLVAIMASCAPKASPSPAPVVPQATPTLTSAAALAMSPEAAAWAKVAAEAKKEGKLIAYDFFMPGDIGIAMKQEFKRSTGIDVEFIVSTGAVLIERIKTERRQGTLVPSVLTSSIVLLYQAKTEGITQATVPLPELQNKQVWQQSPIVDEERHILASSVSLNTPWINTSLVKPGEEPKSWRDLLHSKWKGKISVSDPDTTPSPVMVYNGLVKKMGILDDQYFKDLGKIAVFMPNIRIDAETLARGEVAIAFSNAASSMVPFLQAGAPIKSIDMNEGIVVRRSASVSVLRGSPQPNAAQVFINWWFSKEGQLTYIKAAGGESLRNDVPSFLPLQAQLTPQKPVVFNAEDEVETARLQRERVLKKLLTER